MKGYVVTMMNIRKDSIPCVWMFEVPRVWMFEVVHSRDMHNHPIDHNPLSMHFVVKGSLYGYLGVHH